MMIGNDEGDKTAIFPDDQRRSELRCGLGAHWRCTVPLNTSLGDVGELLALIPSWTTLPK
jgi:hypothetical protein